MNSQANGTVKAIKDGRKVTAYQITNVAEVKSYMKRAGVDASTFSPGSTPKKPSVAKLADLKAKPVKAKAPKKQKAVAKKTEPKEVPTLDAADDDLEIDEIVAEVRQAIAE